MVETRHLKMLLFFSNQKKKKCLRPFNKKTPLYDGLGSKQKIFSNCQATYQKELYLLFETDSFFQRANVPIGLTTPPPVCFSSLFKNPPPTDDPIGFAIWESVFKPHLNSNVENDIAKNCRLTQTFSRLVIA